jgi:ssDNA-binding Zn-finger/Zn-ribbon topoisomerase 1
MSFQYDEVLCPNCNGKMISRKGQYGVFWGCASFPECKGTRDNQGRSKADREKWKAEQEGYEADSSEANQVSFNKNNKKEGNVK